MVTRVVHRGRWYTRWGVVYTLIHGIVLCFFVFFITFTFQLNSLEVLPSAIFWTSRGHRCRPFSPPVRAFNFYRA